MARLALALLVAASLTGAAAAQSAEQRPLWNAAVEPFRIFGPLYYVGTKELGIFAIATPEGLIVLDGGLPESAPRIVASLETLGKKVDQVAPDRVALDRVKILLNSHAHFDHAGGLAELAAKSGARVEASAADADQLEAGGRGDFAWGDDNTYPPVQVDRRLHDGDTVTLGGVTLTAHLTPGHTKGCTTWTATFEEGGERLRAVFYCSLSVPDPDNYRLADNPRYPEIAADYARSFATLRDLPCDLFLAAHASFFDLEAKAARLRAGDRHAFVDPAGAHDFVARNERRFGELLAAAQAGVAPAGAHAATPH